MILDIDLPKREKLNTSKNSQKSIKELNNNNLTKMCEEFGDEAINLSLIQKFYENQIIFITGGTGFLGKILIEKLLRCCSDISRIYVLIRQKKGKDEQQRIQDLLNDSVFDRIKPKLWNLEKMIIGVAGDCSLNNLGLSDDNMNLLKSQVSIVFHIAATVRFDEKLKQAANTNIQSTSSILQLCKGMKHLKSIVHVSTAYTNCFTSDVEEKFYGYSIKPKELLHLVNSLPEDTINDITPKIISPWPNTYTFTKALAEDLIRTENQHLPIGIFRPGIVTSTAYEPIPGWTDNYNGPTGIIAGAASGILRTLHVDTEKLTNLVPVDLTINALVASAWDVSTQTDRRSDDMLIYNFTSIGEAPLSWGMFEKIAAKCVKEYPSEIAIWYLTMQTTKYKFLYYIYAFFLHYIPGLLLDFIEHMRGRKPRLQKAYQKISKMADVLNPFCMNEWKFRNDNVQNMWRRLNPRDQELFQFIIPDFDWPNYFSNYVKGIRVFLFKDDLNTLQKSRSKYRWFFIVHKLLVIFLQGLALWTIWKILRAILYFIY